MIGRWLKSAWGFIVDVAVAMEEGSFRNATYFICPQCRDIIRKGTRKCPCCAASLSWWWDQEYTE